MLDLGLIITGVMIWAGLNGAVRWFPVPHYPRTELLERLYWPMLIGLLAGRVAAAAQDDPASLTSLRALLVVRGGVEFWAGAAVLALVLGRSARSQHGPSWPAALADLAPFILWAYAIYEASCLYRDGCYGPPSPIGLVPAGFQERQLPVGLLVGAMVAVLGVVVRRLGPASPAQRLLLAVGGVAVTRSVASVWLPRLGDGPTRQHLESILVALMAGMVMVILRLRREAPSQAAGVPPGRGPRPI